MVLVFLEHPWLFWQLFLERVKIFRNSSILSDWCIAVILGNEQPSSTPSLSSASSSLPLGADSFGFIAFAFRSDLKSGQTRRLLV